MHYMYLIHKVTTDRTAYRQALWHASAFERFYDYQTHEQSCLFATLLNVSMRGDDHLNHYGSSNR